MSWPNIFPGGKSSCFSSTLPLSSTSSLDSATAGLPQNETIPPQLSVFNISSTSVCFPIGKLPAKSAGDLLSPLMSHNHRLIRKDFGRGGVSRRIHCDPCFREEP